MKERTWLQPKEEQKRMIKDNVTAPRIVVPPQWWTAYRPRRRCNKCLINTTTSPIHDADERGPVTANFTPLSPKDVIISYSTF